MTSSEQQSRTEVEARRLAAELTALVTAPIRLLNHAGTESEFSFADVVRLGGLMLSCTNESFRNSAVQERNREFLAKVFEAIHDPAALERFLFQRISENLDDPEQVKQAIAEVEKLNSGPGAARRILKEALDAIIPKGRPGRPTQFVPERDGSKFLELATNLAPFCRRFLALKAEYPKKSNPSLFDFLASDHPSECSLAQKHSDTVEEVLNDLYFQDLVKIESKARRLADALAGKEIAQLAFSYSIQLGGSLRRARGDNSEE